MKDFVLDNLDVNWVLDSFDYKSNSREGVVSKFELDILEPMLKKFSKLNVDSAFRDKSLRTRRVQFIASLIREFYRRLNFGYFADVDIVQEILSKVRNIGYVPKEWNMDQHSEHMTVTINNPGKPTISSFIFKGVVVSIILAPSTK